MFPSEEHRRRGTLRRRKEDNSKIHLIEIRWEGGGWINLAQDRNKWRGLVNTVAKLYSTAVSRTLCTTPLSVQLSLQHCSQYNLLYSIAVSTTFCTASLSVQPSVQHRCQYNILYSTAASTTFCTVSLSVQPSVQHRCQYNLL